MKRTGHVWREAQRVLQDRRPVRIVVDASGVSYCDGAGIAWLVKLQQHQASVGAELTISGLHG
jgi:anti-anti-sigma regulatory factor